MSVRQTYFTLSLRISLINAESTTLKCKPTNYTEKMCIFCKKKLTAVFLIDVYVVFLTDNNVKACSQSHRRDGNRTESN